MRFKEQHPDWKSYDTTMVETQEFPQGLQQEIHGLLPQHTDKASELSAIVNAINGAIRKEPTRNWGYDYLLDDLSSSLSDMFKGRFERAMDALFAAAVEAPDSQVIDDLNEAFDDHNFGYQLERDTFQQWHWILVDDSVARTAEVVISTAITVSALCQQTADHLEQLVNNLSLDNQRALKDAVRDAMSATESLLARVTGQRDFGDSTKHLQDAGTWGPKSILRDGLTVWNHLHQDHGDIRHGNPNATLLPREEAIYWIERMMAYVNYINRMQRNQNT